MDSTPDFIKHYIDQIINEECIIELNDLSREYNSKKKEIDNNEKHGADKKYKDLTGKDNPNSAKVQRDKLESEYKKKATEVAKKHATKENVPLVEWRDPVSVYDMSRKTEKNFEEVAERMLNKEEMKERMKKQIKEQLQEKENKTKLEKLPTVTLKHMQNQEVLDKKTDKDVSKDEAKERLRKQIEEELKLREDREKDHER